MTFPTNVSSSPEVTGHECLEENNQGERGKAAAAGVAGGAAAGAPGCLLAPRSSAGVTGSSLGLGTLGTASWHRPAPSEVGGKASACE